MASIVKVYRQEMGKTRFIGKKYGDSDRKNGGFGAQWCEWFEKGYFDPLVALEAAPDFEDAQAHIGLMRWKDGEPFQYWIGRFVEPGTAVPDGYSFVDFTEGSLGVCWLKGPESELYGIEDQCAARLAQEKYTIVADGEGAYWFFERYAEPRFTEPDAEGHVILDIAHFVK